MKYSKSKANKKGFTLVEVLVSLAIMAIAVTLLLQLFSADLRVVSRAGDMTWASVKADAGIKKYWTTALPSPHPGVRQRKTATAASY